MYIIYTVLHFNKVIIIIHTTCNYILSFLRVYRPAIMDSHMDSSDILNLFTDLADSKSIDCLQTITLAQRTIHRLVVALTIAPGGSDRELAS